MQQLGIEFSEAVRVPDAQTQSGKLLRHMKTIGSITTMEAYDLYGITTCGQRMTELRRYGNPWNIKSEWFKTPGGALVKRYSMARAA